MNRSLRYTALAAAVVLSLGANPDATAGLPRTATIRQVTSCADDGSAGTLRNAIAAAGSGDSVNLSALACSTITLASGAIVVGVGDLTIHGPGQNALTINGANSGRVIYHSGMGTLSLDNITVAHGHYETSAQSAIGGGCIASNRYGGGVVLDHAKVTSCSVHSTYVAYGGGLSAFTINLVNSTVSGNTASGAAGARGGGVFSFGSTDLADTTVNSNIATTDSAPTVNRFAIGGGLMSNLDLTLTRSVISNNTATTSSASIPAQFAEARGGGAAALYQITSVGSTISDNMATTGSDASSHAFAEGGGLYSSRFYPMTLTDSTVSGNSALSGTFAVGGGILQTGNINVSGSTIADNVSSGSAGGLASIYPITLTNSTISGNRANGGFAGGIESIETRAYINNTTIAFNYARDGGAGVFMYQNYVYHGNPVTLQSSIIARNSVGIGATFAVDLGSDRASTIAGANNLVGTADAVLTLPIDTLHGDPLLLPLGTYGGPTRTHALGPTSPAIGAGNNAANLAFDQRGAGFPRASGLAADIGAFESQGPLDGDLIFRDGFD